MTLREAYWRSFWWLADRGVVRFSEYAEGEIPQLRRFRIWPFGKYWDA